MFLSTFQTLNEVSLAKLSTHETEVKNATSFTVMQSTGDVIIWGEGPRGVFAKMLGHPCAFYVYNKSGGKWRRTKTIKALCRHPWVHMLPITVPDKEELLAVSCVNCKLIRLHNIGTGETISAFSHKEYRPGRMCHGKPGRIYVLACPHGDLLHALELDIAKPGDFKIARIEKTDRSFRHYNGMVAYIPSEHPRSIVVSANIPKKTVRSICFDNNARPGWEHWYGGWEQQIEGMEFFPSGIVYSPRHEALIVADKMNNRAVVLNPKDGSHVQTVAMDGMICVIQMYMYKDQIVVWHCDPFGSNKKERISYFSTPMFAWDKLNP